MTHTIEPELDEDTQDRLTYHCSTCKSSIYWDGVFEGKWFHQWRYCRACKAMHPFEQDGCASWPAILPPEIPQQTILNLGVGRKVQLDPRTNRILL